jgi:hypothetical protein
MNAWPGKNGHCTASAIGQCKIDWVRRLGQTVSRAIFNQLSMLQNLLIENSI